MNQLEFTMKCLGEDIDQETLIFLKNQLFPKQKTFLEFMEDEAPVVSISNGSMEQVPGVRTSTFGKIKVYHVNSDIYHRSSKGKGRYEKFMKYLGDGPVHDDVQQYARDNPNESIMICDDNTGSLSFLKVGKNGSW